MIKYLQVKGDFASVFVQMNAKIIFDEMTEWDVKYAVHACIWVKIRHAELIKYLMMQRALTEKKYQLGVS